MSRIHVERFKDDADIQKYMLTPEDHGGKAIYGLNTHKYDFSEVATQQFWEWHFRNEREAAKQAMDEHEAKTKEFNRLIAERKLAIAEAQPAIRIVKGPFKTSRGIMVRVEAMVGNGPGPLDHYAIMHRRPEQASAPEGGWSQWMKSRRPWNLPFQETVILDGNGDHEVAVVGSNAHGRSVSETLLVRAQDAGQQDFGPQKVYIIPEEKPTEQPKQEPVKNEAPEIGPHKKEHRTNCAWVLTWDFPGIAPSRNQGSFDNPGDLTAAFLIKPTTLRIQLKHGTPSEDFPSKVVIERPVRDGLLVFQNPGDMQTFGLGNARDYELTYGISANVIASGVNDTEMALIWV